MDPTSLPLAVLEDAGIVLAPLVAMLLLAGVTAIKRRRTPARPFIPAQRGGESGAR